MHPGDRRQSHDGIVAASDMSRVRAWAHYDEIVPRDLPAVDRRGYCAGVAGNITADDQDCSDLGNRPAEPGEDGDENLNPFDGEQVRDRSQAGGSVDHQDATILGPSSLDGSVNQRGHDRRGKNKLGQHHGYRGEQQTRYADRARAGQQEV